MRGLKCFLTAALFLSTSTEAATKLSSATLSRLNKDLINIHPAFLLPGFASCSNANIEHAEVVPLGETTFKLVVRFKNLILKESGRGEDTMACSLYSKLPTDFGSATQVMSIVSSRFEIHTHTPKAITGEANFGVGIVDVGGLSFAGDHHLMTGVAAGMEGTLLGAPNSFKVRLMKPLTSSRDLIRADRAGAIADLIRPAIDWPNLFPGLPTPYLLKTTRTGFGSVSTFATGPRMIDVDFGQTQNTVEDGKYIVNQFHFSIKGERGDKQASAQLNGLEIILESQNM
ncbi:MAG: hypothetical protein M3Q07_07050 [Pseudobdellovibrionaceae bacterium]|nr:hypothetical protein [Pseudobdellovibrionaceae bacterium]